MEVWWTDQEDYKENLVSAFRKLSESKRELGIFEIPSQDIPCSEKALSHTLSGFYSKEVCFALLIQEFPEQSVYIPLRDLYYIDDYHVFVYHYGGSDGNDVNSLLNRSGFIHHKSLDCAVESTKSLVETSEKSQ